MPDQDPDGTEPEEPQQLALMRQVVEFSREQVRLSEQRTNQSAQRSEMSAERSYMNAERTLSVWIRTALAAMVVGIAIDRFGLAVAHPRPGVGPDAASTWVGAALVCFGVVIAVVVGVRFWRYAATYCQSHVHPEHHGPFMGPAFALVTAVFGLVLLGLLLGTH